MPWHAGVRLSLAFGLLALAGEALADEPRRVLRSGEPVAVDVDAGLEARTLDSITFLERLLAEQQPSGDTKAEMLFRLSELEYQQARRLFLREIAAFDALYEECAALEHCVPDSLVPDHTGSSGWYTRVVAHDREILDGHPRWKRADEARHQLAFALLDLNLDDDALQAFLALVKLNPDSPLASEAYLQIGEYWFERDEAAKALAAYRQAMDDAKYVLRDYARYKLAWCLYNLGDAEGALDHVIGVAQAARPTGIATESKRGDLALFEEALRDMVRFAADTDQVERVRTELTRLGAADRVADLLGQVAAAQLEQGKVQEAIVTWKQLLAEAPDAPAAPEWQAKIVEATRKLGRPAEVHAEVERLRTTYGTRSAWARANASRPDTVASARQTVEEQLRRVAIENHTRAQRDPAVAREVLGLAAREYAAYLGEFADAEHAYDMRYAYAELLYKTGDHAAAYAQYVAVVEMDPNGKHSRFCAESAIFAADELVKRQTEADGWTEWNEKLVEACDRYAANYPDEKRKNVVYKAAYALYHGGRYAEAAERFAVVIALDPGSREAEQAAHLTLDALALQRDWAGLERWAKAYTEQPGLGSKAFKAEVRAIWEEAAFQNVASAEAGDAAAVGVTDPAAWVAFAEAFPASPLAGKALNNAAVGYRAEGRLAEAIAVRQILVDDPRFGPKNPGYADHLAALGFEHESLGDFAAAATAYERLATSSPGHAAAADAAWSAALFRESLGDQEAAVTDWKAFLASFPSDARAAEATFALARLYEAQSRHADAQRLYTGLAAGPHAIAANLRLGFVAEAQGRSPEPAWKAAVAAWEAAGSPRGDDAAAEAMFRLADRGWARYQALEVRNVPPPALGEAENRAIGKALTAKIEAMKGLDGAYGAVIATGSGRWGLEAAVRMGDTYAEMARTLRASDVPRYLDEEQRALYVAALEDRAWGQLFKARDAWEHAATRGRELGFYEPARAAQERLHAFDPEAYPVVEEIIAPPMMMVQPAMAPYEP